MDSYFKYDLKFLIKNLWMMEPKFLTNARIKLHWTLNKLVKDSTIKVWRFDKGNSVAVLITDNYLNKLDTFILDISKYFELDQSTKVHPLLTKENLVTNVTLSDTINTSLFMHKDRPFKQIDGVSMGCLLG